MAWPPLAPVFFGSLLRRRAASALSVLAIALGVALGLAVQIINGAALEEFDRGMRVVAGEADLQVLGPGSGFDDALFEALALHPLVAAASPVVEVTARRSGADGAVRILGVDVLRVAAVNPALMPVPADLPGQDARFAAFRQDAIFLSPGLQAALGLEPGDGLALAAGQGETRLTVAGGLPAMAGQPLAAMDIHAVQTRFGMRARLTRIDLRLRAGASLAVARDTLGPLLPAGVRLGQPDESAAQAAALSRAYRVNLTMLAVIALVTGGFLVFSTQALSVARRETELAFLRAIGLDRGVLMRWILGEGLLLGVVGGALGCVLGYAFAALAFSLLGGDLGAGYFDGTQPAVRLDGPASLAFVLLGMAAGLLGSWAPARAAARIAPAMALKGASTVADAHAHAHGGAALACFALAGAATLLPPLDGIPVAGYLAIGLILAGGVLGLGRLSAWLAARLPARHVAMRLASARLQAMPGHVVVAAAGVMASAALAVAMAIMVASFRDSVDQWLARVLPAALYLRAAESDQAAYLDAETQRRIASMTGVAKVDFLRYDSIRLAAGGAPVVMIARPVSADGRELPLVGAVREVAQPIWVSEALADRLGLQPGDPLEVPLAGRGHAFAVGGIWRDYARQTGALVLPLDRYRALTGDARANSAALHLDPAVEASAVSEQVRERFGADRFQISAPAEIRRISLRIFDRSFAVTYLLEAAAVGIGLAGIAASFAATAAARRREFGMLRHLGLSRRQVAAMIAAEGSLTAAAGAIGGSLLGFAIALVLVEVVNRQSFHWSMDYRIPAVPIGIFLVCLTVLAAIAAVLAGRHAMGGSAVRAVSEDW